MPCAEMQKAAEAKLKRKLTLEEKEQMMRAHGHTEEEIAEALGLVMAG